MSLKSFFIHRKITELFLVMSAVISFIFMYQFEVDFFDLSERVSLNYNISVTLFYFTLINLNIFIILFLGYLIFRNITKLILEKRAGVIGSTLRAKLVLALVFFAVVPSVILSYVSIQFVTSSFERWFSQKIHIVMEQVRHAGSTLYIQDQKRLKSLAKLAQQKVDFNSTVMSVGNSMIHLDFEKLHGFSEEYGLSSLLIFDSYGNIIWKSLPEARSFYYRVSSIEQLFFNKILDTFAKDHTHPVYSTVLDLESQDVVLGVAPIIDPVVGTFLGLVVTEVRFETQLLKTIETIIDDFSQIKPSAQLARVSYNTILILVLFIIVFAAIWLGFYVAKNIVRPIQSLAKATKQIAHGNYNVKLVSSVRDEMGVLVEAFNLMVSDLKAHQKETESVKSYLQKSNLELENRRRSTEIILGSIASGVLSVDSKLHIISFNYEASRLLQVNSKNIIGLQIKNALGEKLHNFFWQPIFRKLSEQKIFRGQVDLHNCGLALSLMVNASITPGDDDIEAGYVIVFEDAEEQIRQQKIDAWREVAKRIAHEIKNPITPIKLNAQRVLRKFEPEFEGEKLKVFSSCIESILTQVDYLRDLVNEFSKFSRLPKIRLELGSVRSIIKDVINLYRLSYPRLSFDDSQMSSVPHIFIDKEQLNRAFMNIFANSVAAVQKRKNPKIGVATFYLKDFNLLRIEVYDNGCGISKGLRKKVLEPYYSTKKEGTGLGLALVQQIVSEHEGYIRIVSNKPYGARVIIELPHNTSKKLF